MLMPADGGKFNIHYGREFFQVSSVIARTDGKLISASMINLLKLQLKINCDSTYQHCQAEMPYAEERKLVLKLLP
jgi:hypothetical protein